jgi:hypothetical protein
MRPFPEDPRAWLRWAAGGAGDIVGFVTNGGWPAARVEIVHDGVLRVAALYQLFRLGAAVIARGPAATATSWRPRLHEALAAARPDFTHDRVTCLAELVRP